MAIFEAMNLIEGSPMSYQAIRAWEIELMINLQMTEDDYARMSLKERARKVCALHLPGWGKALESHRAIEEMKAKHGK